MKVDHDDDIAIGREQLGIPPVRPVVAPCALGAAVDKVLQRILLALVEAGRPDDEALHSLLG